MRASFIVLCAALLTVVGCGRTEHLELPPIQTEFPEVPEPLSQVWVMSSKWAGFMGAAIGLSSNRYYYWFYSDVMRPDEPSYPIIGDFTFDNGLLRLDGSERDLYSRQWVRTTNAGRVCLWATNDVGDVSRLLIPDQEFDATDPFKNQRQMKAEPENGEVRVPAGASTRPSF